MAYAVGEPIYESFLIRDNLNVAVTGLSLGSFATAEAYLVSSPATTATVTITETGGGEYRVAFTPSTTGFWTLHIVYDVAPVFREIVPTVDYQVATSSDTVIVVGASTSGALTVTLAELVRRLADEFGDLVMLTATALGTTTEMIDTKNVNIGAEELTGRELYFTSGTNSGLLRRITATTDLTGTLTFAAVTGAVASGVTAEVYNKRGRGFLRAEYIRWINYAINHAAGVSRIEVLGAIGSAFSVSSPEVTVPAALTEVFKVEWQDSNSNWNEIKKASRWGNDGWTALRGSGKIRILGGPAQQANSRTIQAWGYGRQDVLVNDDDECALDPDWIVSWAKYRMGMANLDRKPELANTVMVARDDARMDEARLRRLRHPDTAAVRSV